MINVTFLLTNIPQDFYDQRWGGSMNRSMDWNKINIFYRVAQAGSFTHAAQSMRVNQSSLSRQIIDLERTFNTRLFERKRRGVLLTKQGNELYRFAHKTFQEGERLRHFLTNKNYDLCGSLDIMVAKTWTSPWLIKTLEPFMRDYPEVNINIIEDDEPFDSNRFDVLIGPQEQAPYQCLQSYIRSFEVKLFASKEYLAEHGTPQSIHDLKDHRLISNSANLSRVNDDYEGGLLKRQKKSMKSHYPPMIMSSAEGILCALRENMGIAFLREDQVEEAKDSLVEINLELDNPTKIPLYMNFPIHLLGVEKILKLRNYIKKPFSPNN